MSDADSENVVNKSQEPDDVTSIFIPDFDTIKTAIFIFIIFILVCSDVFVDRILSSKMGLSDGRYPTPTGTFIQGALVAVGYIGAHTLISNKFL